MIDSIIITGIILAGLFLGYNLAKLWGRGFKMNYTRRYGFLIYVAVIIGFFNFSKRAYHFLGLKYEIILKWIGYIGIGIFWIVLIAAGIMLYLWLNSLKYKRKK